MTNQLTSNAEALHLFFTEDIYLVKEELKGTTAKAVNEIVKNANVDSEIALKPEPKIYDEKSETLSIVNDQNVGVKSNFDFNYLGKNEKNILILVNDNLNDVSTVQGRELLRKLINAINLTAKDFALVNYAKYNTASYNDFLDFFECKLVLAFGVSAQQLKISEQPIHKMIEYGSAKIIFTANLHDLDSDLSSKKILWTSLQELNK